MKKLIQNLIILFGVPLIISMFFNIHLKIIIMYAGFIAISIISSIRTILKLKKNSRFKNWPYRIFDLNIFYICCYFLLINYYGKDLPELFLGGDKIYHIIYSEPIKSIVYSIMAAIVFTWYTEYKEYSRKYYLYCYLKNHIKELWSIFYNIEYEGYIIYFDVDEKKIDELLLGKKKENLIENFFGEAEILRIKKCTEEIDKILFNMNTPANQSIYYLLQNIERINERYRFNIIKKNTKKIENLTLEISKDVKEILIELDTFEKDPILAIIK